ncbi:MAG: RrF2 family transcriptional regulator [Bacteroidales bacterium]
MDISNKSKIALLALVEVYKSRSGQPSQISCVADSIGVSKRSLEGIFSSLKHSGILNSELGKSGGYQLAKPASTITVLDVVSIFDTVGHNTSEYDYKLYPLKDACVTINDFIKKTLKGITIDMLAKENDTYIYTI